MQLATRRVVVLLLMKRVVGSEWFLLMVFASVCVMGVVLCITNVCSSCSTWVIEVRKCSAKIE